MRQKREIFSGKEQKSLTVKREKFSGKEQKIFSAKKGNIPGKGIGNIFGQKGKYSREKNGKERLGYSQKARSVRKFDLTIAERYIKKREEKRRWDNN